jgi:hypothetical protein
VAEPVIRLTLAELTPGAFSRVRCTLALQAAQVMPETGMVEVVMRQNSVNGKQ